MVNLNSLNSLWFESNLLFLIFFFNFINDNKNSRKLLIFTSLFIRFNKINKPLFLLSLSLFFLAWYCDFVVS